MKVVLASKSPRRKELLSLLDLDFEIISANIDETMNPLSSVYDEVAKISFKKAKAVKNLIDNDTVIISADTVVEFSGVIMGKSKDNLDAKRMLKSLSGNTHRVLTGVTVMHGDKSLTNVEITFVTFRKLSDKEIDAYIATNEPADKAGGYGIQGKGSKFVSRIEGDYFNVVGLPVCTLSVMLKEFGINI